MDLQRNYSRFTLRTITSRWSQASFRGNAYDIEAPPPLPVMPARTADVAVAISSAERPLSFSSVRTGSTTLRGSDGVFDAKGDDSDGYDQRRSTGSSLTSTTATVSVATVLSVTVECCYTDVILTDRASAPSATTRIGSV